MKHPNPLVRATMTRTALLLPVALLALGAACENLQPTTLDDFQVDTGIDAGLPDDDTDADTDATSDTEDPPDGTGNLPPRANAGGDQSGIPSGTLVVLDGSGSSDPNPGDTLTYTWSLVSGPPGSQATITNSTFATAQMYADVSGDFQVRLEVSDGELTDTDDITIAVDAENMPPEADAGFSQTVSVGAVVQLTGAASFDPDGDSLTYSWSFIQRPPGSVASLSGITIQPATSPRFTADRQGTYSIELVVSDGDLNSAPATVSITAVDNTSGGSGGSSGSDDCLDCAAQVDRQVALSIDPASAASSLALGSLPLWVLFAARRREARRRREGAED